MCRLHFVRHRRCGCLTPADISNQPEYYCYGRDDLCPTARLQIESQESCATKDRKFVKIVELREGRCSRCIASLDDRTAEQELEDLESDSVIPQVLANVDEGVSEPIFLVAGPRDGNVMATASPPRHMFVPGAGFGEDDLDLTHALSQPLSISQVIDATGQSHAARHVFTASDSEASGVARSPQRRGKTLRLLDKAPTAPAGRSSSNAFEKEVALGLMPPPPPRREMSGVTTTWHEEQVAIDAMGTGLPEPSFIASKPPWVHQVGDTSWAPLPYPLTASFAPREEPQMSHATVLEPGETPRVPFSTPPNYAGMSASPHELVFPFVPTQICDPPRGNPPMGLSSQEQEAFKVWQCHQQQRQEQQRQQLFRQGYQPPKP